MNYAGNADVSQESDVFRAMAKRLATTPQTQPPPVKGVVFGLGLGSPNPKPLPSSPKVSNKGNPNSTLSLPDMGSIGIYVISGLILGGTFMLSRGSIMASPNSLSTPPQRSSLPSSISIGGMNLDI